MAKPTPDPRAPIVTEWRGHPRYACPFTTTCAFDTLDETVMTAHLDPVNGKHPVATEPRPIVPLTAEERAELEGYRAEKAANEAKTSKQGNKEGS